MVFSSVERASQPVIRLDGCVGTALIISHPTGIIYVNQAGGTACLQPGYEGALVPFGNDVALEGNVLMGFQEALETHFTGPKHGGGGATSGLDDEDAEVIDAIFADTAYGSWFKVDRHRLKDSMEAWVHVIVRGDEGAGGEVPDICRGLGPFTKAAVLIWMNSD